MKAIRSLFCLFVAAALLFCLPLSAAADDGDPYALTVIADGRETPVRALQDAYAGNLFLSLSDLSAALSGTEKQFRFSYGYSAEDGDFFSVTSGQPAAQASGAGYAPAESNVTYLGLRRNRFFVDGRERKYYSSRLGNTKRK